MTSHEKAVNAINARLARLQANLGTAKEEPTQRFLFQSIVVLIGIAEALNDYIKRVGEYAQRRHRAVQQENETLGAQHAGLLQSGRQLLEQLKAAPTDRALRKEIELAQRKMEAIQKTVRRSANALQRELAPALAMIDQLSASAKRLAEAGQRDALSRALRTIVAETCEFYAHQVEGGAIDPAAWEKSATEALDPAADFHDTFARVGYHASLAIELVTLALAPQPPPSAGEATQRAGEAAAARLKEITARFSAA
jgi:hypothetical protein